AGVRHLFSAPPRPVVGRGGRGVRARLAATFRILPTPQSAEPGRGVPATREGIAGERAEVASRAGPPGRFHPSHAPTGLGSPPIIGGNGCSLYPPKGGILPGAGRGLLRNAMASVRRLRNPPSSLPVICR